MTRSFRSHHITTVSLGAGLLSLLVGGCTDARRQSFFDGGVVANDAAMIDTDAGVAATDGGGGGDLVDGGNDAGTSSIGPGRGEACTPSSECGEGLTCVSGGGVSLCVGYCDATEYTGCLRTESCNIPVDAARSGCSPSCDLLTAIGCPSGTTCGVFADETGAVYKDCDSAGTRTQGQDCDSSSKCAPNHVCAYWSSPPFASGWECLQFCDPSASASTCPEGTTCSYAPNEAEPFASIDGLGVCR